LRDLVDDACRDVGRDPSEVQRTTAVNVQLGRGKGRNAGNSEKGQAPPIAGSHEEIARELAEFEGAGIGHIQVVLDPIDARGVEELAEIVALIG
jgi:hypothetical protein